jgi:hypothetical protein
MEIASANPSGQFFLQRPAQVLVLQKPDPLHSVQAQFFSNAFSNAGDYVRSRPNDRELKAQYLRRLRSRADISELKRTA